MWKDKNARLIRCDSTFFSPLTNKFTCQPQFSYLLFRRKTEHIFLNQSCLLIRRARRIMRDMELKSKWNFEQKTASMFWLNFIKVEGKKAFPPFCTWCLYKSWQDVHSEWLMRLTRYYYWEELWPSFSHRFGYVSAMNQDKFLTPFSLSGYGSYQWTKGVWVDGWDIHKSKYTTAFPYVTKGESCFVVWSDPVILW